MWLSFIEGVNFLGAILVLCGNASLDVEEIMGLF